MKTESMLSAGIDIGTTTTHLVISRIGIGVTEGFGTVPSVHITSKRFYLKVMLFLHRFYPTGKLTPVPLQQLLKNNIKSRRNTG